MRVFVEYADIYGKITWEGKELAFTQTPCFAPKLGEIYTGIMMDREHIRYDVQWKVQDEYDPYTDNELAIACDWNSPISVKPIVENQDRYY